jgi:hypothetical protein
MGEKTMYECDDCGKISEENNLTEVSNGNEVCPECLNDYCECTECGCLEPVDEMTLINDEWYCEYCRDQKFEQCDDCGEYVENTTHIEGNNNDVCDDCLQKYQQCDDCGENFQDYQINGDGETDVCDSCYEEKYVRCTDCGSIILRDNANYDEWSEEYYCDDCYNNRGIIKDYNYKPDPIFYGSSKYNAFYGIELEIDKGGESCSNAQEILNIANLTDVLAYCKHDGSICNGFEIVTHPCSIQYHIKNFPWEDICSKARDMEYMSHNTGTCGLHVHISKKGFGDNETEQDLGIAKLLLIFENNWKQIVKFTRRTEGQLNEWANRYGRRLGEDHNNLLNRAKGAGRYFAVNLQPSKTVEIRAFRGTLKKDTLIASIQFCDILVNICNTYPLEDIQDVCFKTFVSVAEDLGYPEFVQYVAERNIDLGEKEAFRQPKSKIINPEFSVDKMVLIQNPIEVGLSSDYENRMGTVVDFKEGIYSVKFSNDKVWKFYEENLKSVNNKYNVGDILVVTKPTETYIGRYVNYLATIREICWDGGKNCLAYRMDNNKLGVNWWVYENNLALESEFTGKINRKGFEITEPTEPIKIIEPNCSFDINCYTPIRPISRRLTRVRFPDFAVDEILESEEN